MTDDESRWLTYEEAAKALGIDEDSVKRRAQRNGWPRMPGNDRRVRIAVPAALLGDDMSGDASPPEARDVVIVRLIEQVERLQDENAGLRQTLATKEAALATVLAEAKWFNRKGLVARLERIAQLRWTR